jgi:hypothetical protein
VGAVCDGERFVEFECDPAQGMECRPEGCVGACAVPELLGTYLGCDYYPTMLANPVWKGFDFAVALANANAEEAKVRVTRGSEEVSSEAIPANSVKLLRLPWVEELKGGDQNACAEVPEPGASRLVKGGAYRVRTDRPVTAYQLSPLDFELTGDAAKGCPVSQDCPSVPDEFKSTRCLSYSNDATLLLPATTLTSNYDALTWPSGPVGAATLAITATRDGTEVEIFGRGEFAAGGGVSASGRGSVKLDRGDVLELFGAQDFGAGALGADVSGTRIRATKPVQVIAGNSCANVPLATTEACDHVEHALLPIETLGKSYLLSVPRVSPKELVVRFHAVLPDTRVTLDPPVAEVPTLGPDSAPFELRLTSDIAVEATGPLLIAGFMLGRKAAVDGKGDPSMTIAVPTQQFRRSYSFVASSTYFENYVNVIAPDGARVTLDDQAIAPEAFSAIGKSGFSVARVSLRRDRDVHLATGDEEFGVQVYGYGQYTSFMYAGGLDLDRITEPPPR